ncbi:DUF1223 domain-containing protein [Sulfitobacter sp. D35]|uniref:DUF1223 domain-containing protein n=1 Tax=Sulfitobacter sp. D35 TaxID=3083252 RepID=UPI00296EB5DF|nr:DUF1223 domain-containing protein [Sulfitobacter sp. D35]MDW4496705.1 DUF1223 domain-containing protein [Sulfitobacter sp. D35]
MKRLLQACAALCMLSAPVSAENAPVVVELFTSQGCSSCPPADAILGALAERNDVIALSLHVDYWDYIGWKDEFADPRYTTRQKQYAMLAGRHSIYTPQMIVNGETDIVGARAAKLEKAIEKHMAQPAKVSLDLERDGARVMILATPVADLSDAMDVHLVRYAPKRAAHITRGENAGKSIEYVNVTEGWTVLGQWDGAAPLEMEAEAAGELPVVVLIQVAGNGPILAAAEAR